MEAWDGFGMDGVALMGGWDAWHGGGVKCNLTWVVILELDLCFLSSSLWSFLMGHSLDGSIHVCHSLRY